MVWGLRDDAVTPQPSAQHTGRLRADGEEKELEGVLWCSGHLIPAFLVIN